MKLFESFRLGNLTLKNRLVMAPMTRSRAPGNLPNELMAEYYAQRSGAGLIITEGTSPSLNGLGYARIPGLFNSAQIEGWKKTTTAVHAKDSRIFVQLMHTGRASHPANMPAGAKIVAPSAIALTGQIWTDSQGMQPYPVPSAMTKEEIQTAIREYAHSAECAIQAGFDGVELHSANGYLMNQFLHPFANQRTDEYGGSDEKRMRFVLEVARETVKRIGGNRVGIRISPNGQFNDLGPYPGAEKFYGTLAQELAKIGLVYIHVVDHQAMGAPEVGVSVKKAIREGFRGTYILSGGYTAERAERDLAQGLGELVAFGRPFIPNPDLDVKLKKNLPLRAPNFDTFYTPGPAGYTDYPTG